MTTESTSADNATRRDGSALSEGLGPLPEARKPDEHGAGWFTAAQMYAYAAQERGRLLALAKKRADYEASAAAHHAGSWHVAYEHHLTRHAAMRDLIDAIQGPND